MNTWKFSGREGHDLLDALHDCALELQPKTYLEIGVDGGGSLGAVLAVSRPELIVLCDIWDPTYCAHGLSNHSHILPHLEWRGLVPATVFLDGDSKVLVPQRCRGITFDLVTVDGDHSAEGAAADLENCWPLLRVGGCLVADDINHPCFPHLRHVLAHFLDAHVDAEIVPEAGALRNCVVIEKRCLV